MRKAAIGSGRSRTRTLRRTLTRFRLEWLEPRELLTAYTVTDTSDNTSMGSLRWAITQVDGDSSLDTIKFAISGTGVQTIDLGSPLPQITNSVLIDGTTQNNSSGPPQIAINGASLSSSASVLDDTGGSFTIKDVAIVGCPGTGIELTGGANDLIEGCYVGTSDGACHGQWHRHRAIRFSGCHDRRDERRQPERHFGQHAKWHRAGTRFKQ